MRLPKLGTRLGLLVLVGALGVVFGPAANAFAAGKDGGPPKAPAKAGGGGGAAAAAPAPGTPAPAPPPAPAPTPAPKAKRVVIFVIESFSADDVARVELATFKALQAQGTYFKNCYICPPTRIRKDKKFGTVVPNMALVTGTVFWTREDPLHTLGEAVTELGNSMNVAAYPSYNCINDGFTHANTKAGDADKFFESAKALYGEAQPIVSLIHPQDPGDGPGIRQNSTAPDGPHLTKLVETDARIGLFIAWLKQANQWKDTLLIITGDHGFVDASVGGDDPHPPTNPISWRVPLLLVGPNVKQGQALDYAELIDLAPTVTSILGVAPPTGCVGRVLGEALVVPGKAPLAPPRKQMLEWMKQIIAFAKSARDETAVDFYGVKRFLEWNTFQTIPELLDHNAKILGWPTGGLPPEGGTGGKSGTAPAPGGGAPPKTPTK